MAAGLESGTLGRYRRMIANHLDPYFGDMDVCDPEQIRPEAIGRWVNSLLAGEREDPQDPEIPLDEWPWLREPLAPKTVRNIHGLFFFLMQTLVDAEVPKRSRNPCRGTNLPKVEDGEGDDEMVFLELDEFASLLAQFDDPDAADLTMWLYGTGLRFSEATALQVRDFQVDGPRPRFRVRRAWKERENGSYYLGTPKTKASVRWVYLTPRQVQDVRPRLAGRHPKDLVFTGPKGGRWTHSTFYTGRWRPALYRAARCVQCRGADYAAGIGRRGPSTLNADQIVWCGHEGMLQEIPRVHDLRHSHVAQLIAAGARLLAISRRLGHKDMSITYNRYGHLLDEVEDDLVAGLAERMDRIAVAV
jgi:integrase